MSKMADLILAFSSIIFEAGLAEWAVCGRAVVVVKKNASVPASASILLSSSGFLGNLKQALPVKSHEFSVTIVLEKVLTKSKSPWH